jgi:hypothetical protein
LRLSSWTTPIAGGRQISDSPCSASIRRGDVDEEFAGNLAPDGNSVFPLPNQIRKISQLASTWPGHAFFYCRPQPATDRASDYEVRFHFILPG